MNMFLRSGLALTILAFWAAPAWAAEKMVPEEGAIELMLLRQQSVQRELKLTADEVEKINKFAAQQWAKAQKAHETSATEQDKTFKDMAQENHSFIEKTLKKEQAKRMHEIVLQKTGILALTRKDVASKLKLTDDQIKKAHNLQREARRDAEELLHTTQKDQKRAKFRQLEETGRKHVMELLNDEQETTWKEMTGQPFTGDLAYFDPDTAK
ncbi:MAG TPA: hypothetical protein VGH74_07305 [Planctomycetaceae bacterium]|jgi:hypothetical protein